MQSYLHCTFVGAFNGIWHDFKALGEIRNPTPPVAAVGLFFQADDDIMYNYKKMTLEIVIRHVPLSCISLHAISVFDKV